MSDGVEKRWKRGEVHPETGLLFWGRQKMKNGNFWHKWVTKADFEKRQLDGRIRSRNRARANRAKMSPEERKKYNEDQRRRRAADPDRATKQRKANRAKWLATKADPELHAAHLEMKRAFYERTRDDPIRKKKRREVYVNWLKNNPEKTAANCAKRRAAKRGLTSKNHDRRVEETIRASAARVSSCLGMPMSSDHVTPLRLGGLHDHRNLLLLPTGINSRKHAKDPVLFYSENPQWVCWISARPDIIAQLDTGPIVK